MGYQPGSLAQGTPCRLNQEAARHFLGYRGPLHSMQQASMSNKSSIKCSRYGTHIGFAGAQPDGSAKAPINSHSIAGKHAVEGCK